LLPAPDRSVQCEKEPSSPSSVAPPRTGDLNVDTRVPVRAELDPSIACLTDRILQRPGLAVVHTTRPRAGAPSGLRLHPRINDVATPDARALQRPIGTSRALLLVRGVSIAIQLPHRRAVALVAGTRVSTRPREHQRRTRKRARASPNQRVHHVSPFVSVSIVATHCQPHQAISDRLTG